jgi:flagellar motility protein MotE (MotC chaperone)
MKWRWWALALGAIALKIYLLGSWLLQPAAEVHAAPPAAATPAAEPGPGLTAASEASPPPHDRETDCAGLIAAVREERAALAERSRKIAERERAIAKREREASEKLARALAVSQEAARALEAALGEREQKRRAGVRKLAKLLAAMRPEAAAQVVARIRVPLAVSALAEMEEKRGGKILGLLPPEKAAEVGEALLLAPRGRSSGGRAPPPPPRPAAKAGSN